MKAAHKKWPALKGDFREKKMRLYQFLARRGYPGHVVKEAVKAAALDDDGSDDGLWLDN
jgi:regulatory protein